MECMFSPGQFILHGLSHVFKLTPGSTAVISET